MTHDELVTSRNNPRVKEAAKLRLRRERDAQGRYLIDGVRELRRAIASGAPLDEIYLCEELCTSDEGRALIAELPRLDARIVRVSPAVLEKLAFGERAEGVVGVGRIEKKSLTDLVLPDDAVIAVLVGVEKPGNLGAMLRSADAAGVGALLIAGGGTDIFNPNAIRASLGTFFSVPLRSASSAEALDFLRARRRPIYAARPSASLSYTAAGLRGGCAFILGSESHGLPPEWNASDITPIAIPMLGIADSLNVSATAAVLFFEALRQRTAK
jgi:TrmH family RNA methyltransferase